ncbi:hypothetical protein F0P96_03075 [Hymenobacter busanensis]|uniref:Uncharacterized protein n=1 Tax=Hymenobacter busanensis TaxID=2607656 RepID=A0A7L4ZUZ0_9BACT|nr:hypothetical protein [Hymenobacter busanensis]KAA9339610.1 hypothetical protein F0P96_03075 [Hymenobacter busanensis]QHJ06635.1 hypothetical protein GUY19_04680 [Hymenobacter busanensis]
MSQRLLVFLAGLLLVSAVVSWVYYRRTVARTPVDLWALVPDDAVLVAATRDHPTLVRHLKETQLWENLATVRYFQQVEESVTLADSLAGPNKRNSLLNFLGTKTVLTSVHVTSPEQFDLLFLVPVSSVRQHRQVRTITEALAKDPRFRVTEREYHGQLLMRVEQRGTGAGLTYFNYRNTLVMSASTSLVEAVVRREEHPGQPSIAADFKDTDYLKLKDVDATVLVNYRQLPAFLGVFFRPELLPAFQQFSSLSRNGLLEMKLTGNRVLFNGFSNPETAARSLHQQLHGQPAARLRMADVLSLRTAALLHFGSSPAALRGAAPADTLAGGLVDSVAASLGTEAALCYLASPSARVPAARVALVHSPNPARTALLLGRLRRATSASPSFERVGAYQLHQAGAPGLAYRLLGPLFARSSAETNTPGSTALIGDYLALADDPAALRALLTDVAAGAVWSRSPTQVAFLQETAPLARLSIVLDTRNSWNVLLRALGESRRAGLLRNETLFQRFPQVALQFVPHDAAQPQQDGQYYTQLVLRHPPVGPAVARPQTQAGAGSALSFRAGLAPVGPVLAAPAANGAAGVLVQDRAGVLHFVTPDNTVAWSDSLGGMLLAPPMPLVRIPGRRPEHLMATARRVFLLDERGRTAPNFPFNLPDTVQAAQISSAPAADGLPARVLVADRYANLFLFDANGNAPAGWQPKRLDFPLAAAPVLLSVGGRQVVVTLLQNGYVYAFDGSGTALPGFPISVGARLNSPAFVESGPTLRRTRLTVASQHGELVTFTLDGDIVQRRRVTTWSRTSTFRVVPDQAGQRYVVVRDDGQGVLTVFDPNGRTLVSQRFVTSAEKPVQFFDFGAGRQVLVLTETGPGKAYLYDARGRLLGGAPFDSQAPTLQLAYEAGTNSYQLYRVVGNELKRLALKLEAGP